MIAALICTQEGADVILSHCDSLEDPDLLAALEAKGIRKFIGFTIPVELARERYGRHFDVVVQGIHETDELRVIDFLGSRAFNLFSFEELGEPVFYEFGSVVRRPVEASREES